MCVSSDIYLPLSPHYGKTAMVKTPLTCCWSVSEDTSTAHSTSLIQQQPVCHIVQALSVSEWTHASPPLSYIVALSHMRCKCDDRAVSRLTDSTEGLG